MPRKPDRPLQIGGYRWIEERAIYPGMGPKLKALIDASGRSVRSVAEEVGVHHTNLLGICAGRTDPRATTVARILKVLGKSWRDLGAL